MIASSLMKRQPNMPAPDRRERSIYEIYYVSILLKGLNALLEIVLGVFLLFTSHFNGVIQTLISNEMVEDPGDFIVKHLSSYLTPGNELFGGLYLLSHGIIKGFIIWGLMRGKLWAYPAGLAVFGLFIAYQVLKWLETHSWILVVLTVFDLFVMGLIWHEYRRAQGQPAQVLD